MFYLKEEKKLERDCHSWEPHFSSERQCSRSQICSKYIYNIQSYEPVYYQNELEVLLVKDLRQHTNHCVRPVVLHTNTILCDILSNIGAFCTYLLSLFLLFPFLHLLTRSHSETTVVFCAEIMPQAFLEPQIVHI